MSQVKVCIHFPLCTAPDGFRHFEQSLRVVDVLENDGEGLNLTYETRNGILCHTTGTQAETIEGRIVRIADRIAYINHDIDDALRAGVLSQRALPTEAVELLGSTTSGRINTLVIALIENSNENELSMGEEIQGVFDRLHRFMFASVYSNDSAKHEENKVPDLMSFLYEYFNRHPELLPEENKQTAVREGTERAVCDYLAGMTDRYAVEQFKARRHAVKAAIGLDMLGDRDLHIRMPANGTVQLQNAVFEAAKRAGFEGLVSMGTDTVKDDFAVFLDAGCPAVNLIDFDYGSEPGKNDYWHTVQDTMDKISDTSLLKAGMLVAEVLNMLEGNEK